MESAGLIECRLDLRGKGGNVTKARILTREPEGKWQEHDDEFTDELSLCLRKFAKVAAAVAKAAVPRYDPQAIVRGINGSRRKGVRNEHTRRKRGRSINRQQGNGNGRKVVTDTAEWE
jgi:hypothetical protein